MTIVSAEVYLTEQLFYYFFNSRVYIIIYLLPTQFKTDCLVLSHIEKI